MSNPTPKTSAVAEAIARQICDEFTPPSIDSDLIPERDTPWLAAIVDAHLVKEREQRERDIADCATIISGLEKEREATRQALRVARDRIIQLGSPSQLSFLLTSTETLKTIDAALAL